MSSEPTVFIVDDDADVRQAMRWLIESVGLKAETYADGRAFLESYDADKPGCLVTDVRMPGISGLELQEELAARGSELPVIIITGFGDVPTAVRALRSGAVDFIEKPFNDQALLERIQRCIEEDARNRSKRVEKTEVAARVARLTQRERDVMGLVVAGRTSKAIAGNLDIAFNTVQAHRARVMRKMEAANLADLVRMVRILEG
jgi:FixJ family two-component response regulator